MRYPRSGAARALLLLLLVPCSPAAAQTGAINGVVMSAAGGPVAGARVTSDSIATTTNSSGAYTLSGVMAGTWKVTASAKYYKSAYVSATAPAGGQVTAPTITLPINYGTLVGALTDQETLAPITGATVKLSNAGGSAQTNSQGDYTLLKVSPGVYTAAITAYGYLTTSMQVTITVGETSTGNATMSSSILTAPAAAVPWAGSNWYLAGANYAWYNYGTDFGTGGWGKFTNWSTIAAHFATMASEGVHVVRWWVFADGRYSPQFSTIGAVSGLDSDFLPDIDQALQIAAANHIYLVLTLMDNSMWLPAKLSHGVKLGGHSAIITSSSVQASYVNKALIPLLKHVAASPYRASVLAYDIVNEPEAQMVGYWGGVGLAAQQVQLFVRACAYAIHQYGMGAYATVGSAEPAYVAAWKGLGLDFYSLHYYPWMDYGAAPGSGLPAYAALNLDRPCIVEEYPTNDVSYGLADQTPQSANWYLSTIYADGYAGELAWSFWVPDSATDWELFQPVYTNWTTVTQAEIGP